MLIVYKKTAPYAFEPQKSEKDLKKEEIKAWRIKHSAKYMQK
jgi:hypothetical protein